MAQKYRVVRDDRGKFQFVTTRYDDADKCSRRGLIPAIAFYEGDSVDRLQGLARHLLPACDQPVISLAKTWRETEDSEDYSAEEMTAAEARWQESVRRFQAAQGLRPPDLDAPPPIPRPAGLRS